MPRLPRLSGQELIKIFETFGFEIIRIRGSHHRMRRIVDGDTQLLTVPVHGNKGLPIPTLRSIYRTYSQR